MASFRCYDNSDVIATLIMTNFHLNTTVVAIFPNACLWRRSLCSNLVLTLKTNCIKPPSYASTAYVVVIRPSFLSDSFAKIWATCEIFLGNWFTVPPGKKFPVRLCLHSTILFFRILQKKFECLDFFLGLLSRVKRSSNNPSFLLTSVRNLHMTLACK